MFTIHAVIIYKKKKKLLTYAWFVFLYKLYVSQWHNLRNCPKNCTTDVTQNILST
jgi:hypothetical protein